MLVISSIFIILAALIHVYIWVLESFLWDKPRGMKVFGSTPEGAAATKEMAVNQGLYNLMLALVSFAGLLILWLGNLETGRAVAIAGAGSMTVAGIFLFVTSPDKRRPALIQLLPPLVGVIALLCA